MTSNRAAFKIERDAIALLGLLSHIRMNWDPPLKTLDPSLTTQYRGYNIHALILDNTDGEVLAMKQNSIHRFESPVDHGEQLAVREAIERLRVKRPRTNAQAVEEYYRNSLFYTEGTRPEDFLIRGCTLYTTLEPCPMCTATLCVCRMKRVVYVTADAKYGGSWDARLLANGGITSGDAKGTTSSRCNGLHEAYYSTYHQCYEQLDLDNITGVLKKTQSLLQGIQERVSSLETKNVPGTQYFDYMVPELTEAYTQFNDLRRSQLSSKGIDLERNARTLRDLKKLCNIPQ